MIKKGIVLAGGKGDRMLPATSVTNKHLLPLHNRPMIYYPIESLMREGITNILVTLGGNAVGDIVTVLAEETMFDNVDFTFRYQRSASGIADALKLAEDFVGNDRFAVFLGDNILQGGLGDAIRSFDDDRDAQAMVFLKKVPDPHRFGVAVIEDDRIVDVVEKPADPLSDLAVIGVYLYTPHVFSVAQTLKPSRRNELEISDIQRHYAKAGTLRHRVIDNDWTDAGTPYSFVRANMAVMDAEERERVWNDTNRQPDE